MTGTLSGKPLSMTAGLAQLKQLAGSNGPRASARPGESAPDGYARLDQLGLHFETGLNNLLTTKGIPHRINRVGSMFCLYFIDEDIRNVSDVMKQDFEIFKKLF